MKTAAAAARATSAATARGPSLALAGDGGRLGRHGGAALPAQEGHRRGPRRGRLRARSPGVGAARRPRAHGAAAALARGGLRAPGSRRRAAAGLDPRFAVPLLLLAALLVKNVFAYLSEFALNSIGLAMVRDLRRDAYRALLDQSTRFSSETLLGRADEPAALRRRADPVGLRLAHGGLRPGDPDDGARAASTCSRSTSGWRSPSSSSRRCSSCRSSRNFRKLRRTGLSARERIGEMGAILGETLRGHRLIKTYAMEDFEAERFGDANRRYFAASRQSIRLQALNSPADGDPRRGRPGARLRLRRRPDPRRAR